MARIGMLALVMAIAMPSVAARAAECDLTGPWRSTLGAMDLVQADFAPGDRSGADALTPLAEQELTYPDSAATVVSGGFDSATGRGRLVGTLEDGNLILRWAAPESFAAPEEAGDVEALVSTDCSTIEGRLRLGHEGDFAEPFVARRVEQPAAVPGDGRRAEVEAVLDAQLAASRNWLEAIDEAVFDPAALAKRIGGDPEALFGFVRDAIAYEPYAGVLRGAEGTLIARAGNAADKALLLAAMLRAQGHEVRFARAELRPEQAAALTAVVAGEGELPRQDGDADDALLAAYDLSPEEAADIQQERRAAEAALLNLVRQESAREQAFLDGLLAASALPDPDDPAAALLASVSDHVWLQLRTAEGWQDLDPSPLGAAGGATAVETLEALPPSLYHTVEIMVFIEASDGSALISERVGGWSLAAADVMRVGLPAFRLVNLPLDRDEALAASWSADDLRAAARGLTEEWLLAADAFQPVLLLSTGETQVGSAFDLSGRVLSDDWQIRLAEEMQDVLEGGFESMGDALGGLFDEPEETASGPSRLTAVWYEFRLVAPDGEARSHLRTLFDRLGVAKRAAGDAALPENAIDDAAAKLALGLSTDFLITGGAIDPTFALWRQGAAFLANAPFLHSLVELRQGQSFSPELFADYARYPKELLSFLGFRQSLVQEIEAETGVELVQGHPHLLIFQQGLHHATDEALQAIRRIDLLEVAMSAVPDGEATRGLLGKAQRAYGVAVTALERGLLPVMLARQCADCEVRGFATTALFRHVREEGGRFAVVGPGQEDSLAALDIGADRKAYFKAELSAGRWLVLPRDVASFEGRPVYGWWRIDPASGATLGMMQSGAGEGYAEYVIVTTLIFFGGNVGAMLETVVGSPFDDQEQSLVDVVICGFVAALCPEMFGYGGLGLSQTDEYGFVSCRVGGAIAGRQCAYARDTTNAIDSDPWSRPEGESGGGSSGGHGHCDSCGQSLPPNGGR